MTEQSTNPNSAYLRLLELMGQQNANEGSNPKVEQSQQSSIGATQELQNHFQSPSVLVQQLLIQQRLEEDQRAAALLTLARNVSPDLLALALLRKQQEQNAIQHILQNQARFLEAGGGGALPAAVGVGPFGAIETVLAASSSLGSREGIAFLQGQLPDDRSNLPAGGQDDTAAVVVKEGGDRKNSGAFPRKLHQMLLDLQNNDQGHIASFIAGGRAFHIHQPKLFADLIMPKYFRMGRFSSFQRQLNLYDFQRIMNGPHKGGYFHEMFTESKPGLTTLMKRNKIKGANSINNKQHSSLSKNELLHQMQQQQEIQQAVAMAQDQDASTSSAEPPISAKIAQAAAQTFASASNIDRDEDKDEDYSSSEENGADSTE